ncbi:MAG: hypothetical protein ACR2QT_03135 [Woeseiaceae bacterium]
MSSEKTTQRNVSSRSEQRHYKIDKAAKNRPVDINEIDITALQLDASYDVDCDPYNSTGQFLVNAQKKKDAE